MALDPSIPLMTNPPAYDPVRAMETAAALTQMRIGLQSAKIQEALNQRQLYGMQTYGDLIRQHTRLNPTTNEVEYDDPAIEYGLTQAGLPDWAEAHMKQAAATREARTSIAQADMKLKQARLANAIGVLNGFELKPEDMVTPPSPPAYAAASPPIFGPEHAAQPTPGPGLGGVTQPSFGAPSGLAAPSGSAPSPVSAPNFQGQQPQTAVPPLGPAPAPQASPAAQTKYEAMLTQLQQMGVDTGEFPTMATQVAVNAAKARLMNTAQALQMAADPLGTAAKLAGTRKDVAEAEKAEAEAQNLLGIGAQVTGVEALGLKTWAQMHGYASVADIPPAQRMAAIGEVKAALQDPQMRALTIASRQTQLQISQFNAMMNRLLQQQMGLTGDQTAPPDFAHTPDLPLASDPASNRPNPAWGGYTPNMVYQEAMSLLTGSGSTPSMGMGGSPIRVLPANAVKAKAAAIAAAAGMTESDFKTFYQLNKASLGPQIKAYDTINQQMKTADLNSDQLKTMIDAGQLPDLGSPALNKPLRAFVQDVQGNPQMAPIATYLQSITDEYGRILRANAQGGGGGVLSDQAVAEANKLLNPNATVAQMLGSIAALRTEGGNRLKGIGEIVQEIQRRMTPGASTAPTLPGAPLDLTTMPPKARQLYDSGQIVQAPDGRKWKKGPTGPVQVP